VALADIPVTYVVGAPRSGTTWVQLMLGSHPEIATPIELDFFSSFVAPWYESWRVHRLAIDRPARPEWGLPAALTEEEFVEAVGLVVERVYRSVLAAKPGATLMLEKDPRYCSHVETILRTVPHAKFVHVLRDGRDVACSMTRVAQSWGRDWAPGGIGGGAALWQEAVRGAQTRSCWGGGGPICCASCSASAASPTISSWPAGSTTATGTATAAGTRS
jgi:sulfotransferase family protein